MASNLSSQVLQFPPIIEKFIFYDLGGFYEPNSEKVKENLNANQKDLKAYLGTYFPRSFAESYTIFADLINNKYIKNIFENKSELFILDIGSGTGGNLLGFSWFINKFFKSKRINIVSIDGNSNALYYQKILLKKFLPRAKFRFFKVYVSRDNFKENLQNILNRCQIKKFDVIMVFKLVNELYRTPQKYNANKGMYKVITETISDFINKDGLFILTDVTDPAISSRFLSKIMNGEILDYLNSDNARLRPILPLSCAFWYTNCRAKNCFTNREIFFKFNDYSKVRFKLQKSKISYKVLANEGMASRILEQIQPQECYRISKDKTCEKGDYKTYYGSTDEARKYKNAFYFATAK